MLRKVLYIIGCASAAQLALTQPAHAAEIAYDGFETDTAGNNLDAASSGSGWTSDWSAATGHVTVQSKSLVDPSALVSGGSQAVRIQPTTDLPDQGNFISRSLPDTTGTLYMSLLFRHESGVDSGDFINFQVSNGATGNSSNAMGIGIRNAGGNPFFARAGSSSNATTNASTNAAEDATYLLVAKFSKDGSSDYNRTDLYINPMSTSEPVAADATATFAGTNISTLSLFTIRNFNPESGDTIFLDELRLASTFEDALAPESSSLALLGLAGLIVVRRRRS